jgi:RNA-splicing ligase RtcB
MEFELKELLSQVVQVVARAGLAKKVAWLRPIGVVKG